MIDGIEPGEAGGGRGESSRKAGQMISRVLLVAGLLAMLVVIIVVSRALG